ncbi:methylcrotonoyl-CoA carboxylase subunit alpha, mitochondrial-like [Saccoglossus kowalevskii]|uniref:Methylcrotonoyl-CoA carboxylase subunit alpha, mitochondrial-like n=1 Tax=Saccoglossus kowalevskii TaxID=10224 RepID=A0ABM0MYB0_SACKO|nr:PREDICTED: methylcrotonoyl-CoA carboxylase subunit alpha, mitochondrial-like [Saccoglossus kowalevskii]
MAALWKSGLSILQRQQYLKLLPQRSCICTSNTLCSSIQNIDKVLIANRGEIACRVIDTSKKLGIRTVAVYSDVDQNALHVSKADEAYHIGPAEAKLSYLDQRKLIDVAKKSGAKAIHPGYGFLSENTEFAQLCSEEDIIFIGPPASAIRDMGIKSHTEVGMRIVKNESEFQTQLDSAKREALGAFKDDVVLLEKYIETPRHVEVQVFGDQHGNYVYLFERDCSVQRRHQKIIEEAPAPGITDEIRQKLGVAAVQAARAVNYVGAGTVEFIMDKNHDFYFMEMNTRLQVEHPVTEMVTGLDLVDWQLQVASGKPLPLKQEELSLIGHAFEARVYAEDPRNSFLPGAGKLTYHKAPDVLNDTVRLDTGVQQGDEVSVFYDPMISKLVVWSNNRTTALNKLTKSLQNYQIVGLKTNMEFLQNVASHSEFHAGNVHTGFIDQHYSDLLPEVQELSSKVLCQAALVMVLVENSRRCTIPNSTDQYSPFATGSGRRLNETYSREVRLLDGSNNVNVTITYNSGNAFTIKIRDETFCAEGNIEYDNKAYKLNSIIDGVKCLGSAVFHENTLHYYTFDSSYEISLPKPEFLSVGASVIGEAVTPMPSEVVKVNVTDGESVVKGQILVVVIAMKMELGIAAPRDGIIEKVLCQKGDSLDKDVAVVQYQKEDKET